jgi:hypothetical protein
VTEADFSFANAHIDVRWERFDDRLLARFLRATPTLARDAARFSDRVLIFHRGVGHARLEGTFLREKLDLLMQWVLVDPAMRLALAAWTWFMGTYDRRKRVRRRKAVASEGGPAIDGNGVAAVDGGGGGAVSGKEEHSGGGGPGPGPGDPQSRVARRCTMRQALPTVRDVVRSLFKTTVICEPTFKEVVIVYRDGHPAAEDAAATATAATAAAAAAAAEGGGGGGTSSSDCDFGAAAAAAAATCSSSSSSSARTPHSISLKHFVDVPMADAELLFPHTAVHAPVAHQVQVGVTLLLALVGMVTLIADPEVGWGSSFVGVMALVATRVASMYTSLSLGKEHVRKLMNEALFRKLRSSSTGVLLNLAESMEEQECKESMLAFWALRRQPEGQTKDDLDRCCERVLRTHCGVHCDFEVVDALHKLRHQDRLIETLRVREQGETKTRYQAKPMHEVLRKLDEQWDGMFG